MSAPTREQISALVYLVHILDTHQVLTHDSVPAQVECHPYTNLITDLMDWKDRW